MFVLTLTERTPTRPEEKDIHTLVLRFNSMFEVLDYLEGCELNFTCWVNVNITYVAEENNAGSTVQP